MSVKSAPYYWLECDAFACRRTSTEGCEFTAWQTPEQARDTADESEWRIVAGYFLVVGAVPERHYCHEHAGNACSICGEYDATPYAGEREYLCVACAASAGIIVCSSCGMPADDSGEIPHDHECEAIK